jgi:glycosyltransferase involved in cell wall biosynthesis
MMRPILLNATAIGPRPDGISTYAVELLRSLAALDSGLAFRVLLNEAARERLRTAVLPAGTEVEWASAALSPHLGSRGNLARRLHAEWQAWRRRHALVVALSPLEAPVWGAPSVVTVHDLTPLQLPHHHPRQRHFYKRALPPALRRAVRLIVPSRSTRDALVARFQVDAGRVRVIPHGSPVPLRTGPRGAREGQQIVCIGRPGPVKNLETLLRAFIDVHQRVPGRLVLAGVGVEASRWSALPLGPLNGRVRFVPDLSDDEKVSMIDDAALLVDASMDEGFGFPALEAMSRGCPVAAASTGALPEVCGDAAEYFDPGDVGGLAALLTRVLPDAERRAEMSARGRLRAESFSWERAARAHVEVYEEALRETERP